MATTANGRAQRERKGIEIGAGSGPANDVGMDSLVIHGAGPNQTPGSRLSLTVGYHSVDELSRAENPCRVLVRGQRHGAPFLHPQLPLRRVGRDVCSRVA